MRERYTMTGFDMEQNSQSYFHHPEPSFVTNYPRPNIPHVNSVPNLEAHSLQEPYDNSSSMFYAPPEYHHQRASPNFYSPYTAYHAPPPSHGAVVGVTSTEHDINAHFMDQGYKRKSAELIPGNSQYPSNASAPCSFPTPETAPFSFPQYGTYPQPVGQRTVRNRAGAATMDPLVSHGHNNFVQGNYAAHPFPPLPSIWYDQRSDGLLSPWSQAPPAPYMHGNVAAGSIDSGNVCFPRYHETPSTRDPTPFVDPRDHYISHQTLPPPSPGIVYHHMASASYTVPEARHDASYSHVGPVQSTGLRIHQQQHPQDNFVPAPSFRYHGLGTMPADEGYIYGDGNYDDHHRDMRLDIDDMSYEELLDLSEQIGSVNTGLSEKDVGKQLKRRTCLVTRINLEEAPSTDLETDSCSICQENYESQDKIATLDCRHAYHAECLKKWLVLKNICPICKSEALVMEKEKKKIRLSRWEEVSADSS